MLIFIDKGRNQLFKNSPIIPIKALPFIVAQNVRGLDMFERIAVIIRGLYTPPHIPCGVHVESSWSPVTPPGQHGLHLRTQATESTSQTPHGVQPEVLFLLLFNNNKSTMCKNWTYDLRITATLSNMNALPVVLWKHYYILITHAIHTSCTTFLKGCQILSISKCWHLIWHHQQSKTLSSHHHQLAAIHDNHAYCHPRLTTTITSSLPSPMAASPFCPPTHSTTTARTSRQHYVTNWMVSGCHPSTISPRTYNL